MSLVGEQKVSPYITCSHCGARLIPDTGPPLDAGVYGGRCRVCSKLLKFQVKTVPVDHVTFTVNKKSYTVKNEMPAEARLVDFLRDQAHLPGTKFMCRQGGCGSCIVSVKRKNPLSELDEIFSVNSCLAPLYACDGWEITTVEGLGNKKDGYHPVQSRLAQFNGTQCGYCSPGFVMSMYSTLERKGSITVKEAEDSLDGNFCRCTGYRPIVDCFKSFAKDAPADLRSKALDIEDMICPKTNQLCIGNCKTDSSHYNGKNHNIYPIHMMLEGGEWYRPTCLEQLFEIIQQMPGEKYMLVGGHTERGLFEDDTKYNAFIDVKHVSELLEHSMNPVLTVGGAVTLADFIPILEEASKDKRYSYAETLAAHVEKIANIPVRNVGTIAGNLMLKHRHKTFPSDVFLLLATVGGKINIGFTDKSTKEISLPEFLNTDMEGKVILTVTFPPVTEKHILKLYRIARAWQNAASYMNAGFFANVDNNSNYKIKNINIVYGAISADFIHATKTEAFLVGKELSKEETLKGALAQLEKEVQPVELPLNGSPQYRKKLVSSLFYKFVLHVVQPVVSASLRSGGEELVRPLSFGKQTFETDKEEWPLNKPILKVEAQVQCSGEAQYINDIPKYPEELHAAFVLSTVGNATLTEVDPSEALKMHGVLDFLSTPDIPGKNSFNTEQEDEEKLPGVIAFLNHSDIPGVNSFMRRSNYREEVFCTRRVRYAGQAIGMIVAETRTIALEAAQKVTAKYGNMAKPILTIKEALQKGREMQDEVKIPIEVNSIKGNGDAPKHEIKGEFQIFSQYHYTMETQICLCVPTENGLDVYSATQTMDSVQGAIANVLKMNRNKVYVHVRRLGGGYGAKISRASHVAAACSLAAVKLNKPVRFQLDLETNLKMVGKRQSCYLSYEAGVNEEGKILNLKASLYSDVGCHFNESVAYFVKEAMKSCYDASKWTLLPQSVRTNTASNTYCRAPGTTEAIANIEYIMEHIAKVTKKDPLDVRLVNMNFTYIPKGLTENPLPALIESLLKSADYEERKKHVAEFNKANRWKKQGLYLVPMKYPLEYPQFYYNVLVSIYHEDGTVSISHGGIEMGQGINTKAVQVCAHTLGIEIDLVNVQPVDTLINPNGSTSGGSMTSELVCKGVEICCTTLLERIKPIRETMKHAKWPALIETCFKKGIDLSAHHWLNVQRDGIHGYDIWGVGISEVDVDVLTGECMVKRVDILEDAGKSLSPLIDIGQVEGAFVMGMGYWLTEELIYNPTTGELLNTRSQFYNIPTSKDIPADFRVTFRSNAPNPFGVLRSKATGEPPLCLASCVFFAIKKALESARDDAGDDKWFQLDGPATPEKVLLHSLTDPQHFTLH